MFRIMDNEDGKILAIVFDEDLAMKFLRTLPVETLEDGETIRYGYTDCFQHPEIMIGQTLALLGESIQMRYEREC